MAAMTEKNRINTQINDPSFRDLHPRVIVFIRVRVRRNACWGTERHFDRGFFVRFRHGLLFFHCFALVLAPSSPTSRIAEMEIRDYLRGSVSVARRLSGRLSGIGLQRVHFVMTG